MTRSLFCIVLITNFKKVPFYKIAFSYYLRSSGNGYSGLLTELSIAIDVDFLFLKKENDVPT